MKNKATEKFYEKITDNIRHYLYVNNITQRDFAKKLGIKEQKFSQKLNNKDYKFNLFELVQISKEINYTLDKLVS